MALDFPSATLVRFNTYNPYPVIPNLPRFISFAEDIQTVIASLLAVL
jgi:hypothetical protein